MCATHCIGRLREKEDMAMAVPLVAVHGGRGRSSIQKLERRCSPAMAGIQEGITI